MSESAAICDDCGHPMTSHGPDGCEVEVCDWGTLDCTCENVYVGSGPVGEWRLTPEGRREHVVR